MKSLQPVPLTVNELVRIGRSGSQVWVVRRFLSAEQSWELRSGTGSRRYIPVRDVHTLRRFPSGPPIAPGVPHGAATARPLRVNDKVLFVNSPTRILWTVEDIDVADLKMFSGKAHRYMTWRDVEHGKLLHADGAPIILPDRCR